MLTQTPQDQYVKVGQINTRYWASGDKGTTVILLHGLGGFIENWVQNIGALAERHCVYAIDLVGFGRSDKPPVPYSVPYLARFVSDFMATQGLARATLVGHSMGGAVALQFAILFPGKVDKLVLVDSAGLGKQVTLTLRSASVPILGELLIRPTRRVVVQILQEVLHDPALITDELIEISYEISALSGLQKSYLKTLRSMINFGGARAKFIGPILDNLATIAAPTLIVWGQQDRMLPVAQAHAAAKVLRTARLQVFDPCGHMPQLECAEEFNTLVLEFLN